MLMITDANLTKIGRQIKRDADNIDTNLYKEWERFCLAVYYYQLEREYELYLQNFNCWLEFYLAGEGH